MTRTSDLFISQNNTWNSFWHIYELLALKKFNWLSKSYSILLFWLSKKKNLKQDCKHKVFAFG